jgi:hypothetical protein
MQFKIMHSNLNELTTRKSFDEKEANQHDECSVKKKLRIIGIELGNTYRKSLQHLAQETAVSKLSA